MTSPYYTPHYWSDALTNAEREYITRCIEGMSGWTDYTAQHGWLTDAPDAPHESLQFTPASELDDVCKACKQTTPRAEYCRDCHAEVINND